MSDFNSTLFATYNSLNPKHPVPPYDPGKFGEQGFINATNNTDKLNNYPGTKDKNCPAAYYFAPQREHNDDLNIVINSNISPEMRLTAMNEWIATLAGSDMNDIQWRYDELNYELSLAIQDAQANGTLIDDIKARQLIDFRAPGSVDYTVRFPRDNWQSIMIRGNVSLCELKSKVITRSR